MDNPRSPLLRRASATFAQVDSIVDEGEDKMDLTNLSRKSQWIILAVTSGACAAFNGVFAKLYVPLIVAVSY
jgi:hypothetical protein